MKTTSNKFTRGFNDTECDNTYGINTCPSLIGQDKTSNGIIDQEQHIANEPELSKLNQCLEDKSPSVTIHNKAVRHIKLKINEASSTLRAKDYQNLDSEEGDNKKSGKM